MPDPAPETQADYTPPPRQRVTPGPIKHPEAIGPYKVLSVLGEGGFGIVYLAERREPMVQRVALKVVKPGMDSRAVIARFEQERQALAVMDHPHVARVFDAGATPEGRPYFVMELVRGEPITEYCDRNRLSLRERLELFIPVCEAVQHAHSKGVIHRDIKPTNILVEVNESPPRPIPKVIDFGVAKAIRGTLTEKTVFTEMGQLIGTPEYMSPEQAEMGATDIDTRTDVYSLGVVLYELLTGLLPFDPQELRSRGYAAIQRVIREEDPPTPSKRLTTVADEAATKIANERHSERDTLAKTLRRELEWIPLKALRKDRAARYRTPVEMADDIRNYLEGRPLIAGPESGWYRAKKLARKHRSGLVVGGVVAAVVFITTTVSVRLKVLEGRARHDADVQASAAEEINRFLYDDILKEVDPEVGGADTKLVDVLDLAAARMNKPGMPAGVRVRMARSLGESYLAVGRPADAERFLTEALQLLGPAPPADPGTVAEINGRLGEAKYRLAEGDKAVDLLKEQVTAATARFGATDRRTMDLRNQLGGALKFAGKLDEAEAEYKAVLADRTKVLGAGDVDVLITRHNLNLVALQRARRVRAEGGDAAGAFQSALAERAVITRDTRAALKPDHPQTLASWAEELGLLAEAGRPEEALAQYPTLIEAIWARLGPSHWRTCETMARFGRALMRAGRHAEAADRLQVAIELYRFVRPRGFRDTVTLASWTAECLEKSGRVDRAAEVLERMHADLVEGKAAADALSRQACAIRDLYTRAGRAADAAKWEDRCAGSAAAPPK